MRTEMKVWILVAMAWAGCGAVFGQRQCQSQAGAVLGRSIGAGELAVTSGEGRTNGAAWLRLAILYQDAARYDDAERAFRKATAFLRTENRARYADALDGMGVMYVEVGKYAKAEALERKALAIREEAQDAVGVGRSDMHLSLIAYGKHDLRQAEANAEMAVSLLVPDQGGKPPAENATPEERMSALIDLALIRWARGECGASTQELERALKIATANYPANSVPVGLLHFLLGYTHTKSGDAQGGAVLMKTGISEMKSQIGWGHPTYVAALNEYRAVLMKAGRREEAGEVGESIAKLGGPTGRPDHGTIFGLPGVNALR